MVKQPILIIGSGGHAKVVLDAIEQADRYSVEGLVTESLDAGASFSGYPVLGRDADLAKLFAEGRARRGVVAIGENRLRAQVVARVRAAAADFEFVTVVHPSAIIGRDVSIGEGAMVLAGACINPSTTIGPHVIVNTRASIDHDGAIGEFASIAPGATLGGKVTIGPRAAIGLGASLIPEIVVGEDAIVGAGSVVVRDIAPSTLAYGVPCRVIRSR